MPRSREHTPVYDTSIFTRCSVSDSRSCDREEIPAFYGTSRITTMFTRACHRPLSRAREDTAYVLAHSFFHIYFSITLLCVWVSQVVLSLQVFWPESCHLPMCAAYLFHAIFIDLFILIIFGKVQIMKLVIFLHLPVLATFFLQDPFVQYFSTLPQSSFKARDQDSRHSKTTGNIPVPIYPLKDRC